MIISWKLSQGRGYLKCLNIWYYFLIYWLLLLYNWLFVYFKFLTYITQIYCKRWVILSSPKCHKVGRYKILQALKLYKYFFTFNYINKNLDITNFITFFKYLLNYNARLDFNLGYLYCFSLKLKCLIYRYICVYIHITYLFFILYNLFIFVYFIFCNFFSDWYRYFFTSYVFYGFRAQIFGLNTATYGAAGSWRAWSFAVYSRCLKALNKNFCWAAQYK